MRLKSKKKKWKSLVQEQAKSHHFGKCESVQTRQTSRERKREEEERRLWKEEKKEK
jgi:hypothetical protein